MSKGDIVTLDQQTLKKAMQSVLKDKNFRDQLAKHPIKTLETIGVKLSDEFKEHAAEKSLAEMMKTIKLRQSKYSVDVLAGVEPEIEVGTDPYTNPAVGVVMYVGVCIGLKIDVKEVQETVDAINLVTHAEEGLKKNLDSIKQITQSSQK